MIRNCAVRGRPGIPVTSFGMPIIHSANSAASRGRPPGPGSAGGGAGWPRTCSQRRIAGSYSPQAAGVTLPAGVVRVLAAASRSLPLWWPLPGRPPRRPCPFGEVPVSGVGSSRSRPALGCAATLPGCSPARWQVITSGRPVCRLAPEGRCPPSCGARSAELSLAMGVGSSRIAIASGVPIPLPLRPSCFCRFRRASQDSTGSVSLNAPATGVGSSRKPGAGGGLAAQDE